MSLLLTNLLHLWDETAVDDLWTTRNGPCEATPMCHFCNATCPSGTFFDGAANMVNPTSTEGIHRRVRSANLRIATRSQGDHS